LRGGLVTQVPFVVLADLMGRNGLVWSGSVHGETNLVVHGGVFWVFRSWCCGAVALFWLLFWPLWWLWLLWPLRLHKPLRQLWLHEAPRQLWSLKVLWSLRRL